MERPSANTQSLQAGIAAQKKKEREDRLKVIEEEEKKSNEKPNPNAKSKLLQGFNMDILMGRNQ